MDLMEYFNNKEGFGVLSTSDDQGKVDAAAYAKPHVIDEDHVAFIMGDKLSYYNLTKNPYAVYLFREDSEGYEGQRLYLKKESETEEQETIKNTCKTAWPGPYRGEKYLQNSFLVTFKVETLRPLVVYEDKE